MASADGHEVSMDAKKPIGTETSMTPKELVIAGLCGCAGVDIAAYLKKKKVTLQTLVISAEVQSTKGTNPSVFEDIFLKFEATGNLEASLFEEAVKLSQTQYCGVSAMLVKTAKIGYTAHLNGHQVSEGEANFS